MMKKMKRAHSLSIIVLMLFSLAAYGQTANEAAKSFNAGLKLIDEDPKAALEKFQKTVEMCEEIGPEAETTKIKAETQIPTCYYKIGYKAYKAKDYAEALNQFKKAAETGDKFNPEIKEKAENYIPALYFIIGYSEYKKDNYAGAIENFDKSLDLDEEFVKSHYFKALSFYKQEQFEKAAEFFLNTIKYAEGNEAKYGKKAEDIIAEVLTVVGVKKRENNLNEESVEYLEKALKYEEDTPEKKAKIYFEMGNTYKAMDNTAKACEAYKNAAHGDYKANAEYQLENVLNCN
jgi:tetratricopeptide (TPR) repeat protein